MLVMKFFCWIMLILMRFAVRGGLFVKRVGRLFMRIRRFFLMVPLLLAKDCGPCFVLVIRCLSSMVICLRLVVCRKMMAMLATRS